MSNVLQHQELFLPLCTYGHLLPHKIDALNSDWNETDPVPKHKFQPSLLWALRMVGSAVMPGISASVRVHKVNNVRDVYPDQIAKTEYMFLLSSFKHGIFPIEFLGQRRASIPFVTQAPDEELVF